MAEPAGGERRIVFLGGAAIEADGAPVRGRAAHRHPLAILALLVANGGRSVTRDKLIALLWPERDADAGRNLLKVNLHELRKQLGEAAIRSAGDQLSADVGEISCDVTDFLASLAAGDDRAAVERYAGPFLDGFFLKEAAEFERWVESERARLAGLYASALERLATAAEEAGDRAAAVRWRRAAAEHDPYHPDAATRLVRALATSGDRAGAIRFADAFAQRRRDELGIEDEQGITTLARTLTSAYTPSAVVPAGESRRPVEDVGDAPAPRTRDVRAWGWGVGVVAIAIAASVWMRGRGDVGANGAASPEAVAIMPFRVVGADTTMRDAEATLLAARFTGGAGPEAIDAGRVFGAFRRASRDGPPSLAAEQQIAKSLDATRLLSGEIVAARDSIVVSARLYAVATGAVVASARADARSGTSLATIADRLAIQLLARAGGEPEDRLAGLLERPFCAVRTYLAAQVAYKSARYAAAESLYARALGEDSTFGAAGLGLAMANSWTVINEHYGIGRDAALHHLAGMSERDRAFANAFFGPDPALGAPQPAPVYLTRWEDLVEKYPDWTEAWYQLGDRYYHDGGLSGLADAGDRAREAFRRALSQDPRFAAPLHHLVELYAARGERADLRAAGDRYFAANPSVRRDRSAIGWEIAMAEGDSAALKSIRANFDSMPPEELSRIAWVTDDNGWPRGDAERAAGLVDRRAGTASEHESALILEFTLAMNAGREREARVAAAALGAQFPDRPVGALWDLYGALFGDGDTALARDAAGRLESFAAEPVTGDHVRRDQQYLAQCMVGYWNANRGSLAPARAALQRLASELPREKNNFAGRNGRVCQATLAATLAERSGASDAKQLVARLDTILLENRVPPHVILEAGTIASARLHAALGDTSAALVAARRREHLTGPPIFLSTELREEAMYARAMGDTAGAARALRHLEALRSGRPTP
ncbi:MAG TPA: BTAD domain-containing putative transcriptional regulator [Gemmatimonadaceae bacterium]|nr:BTAD domain-containing putative transcriptional regulator [Gemmatimonadaceae bacterium]